MTTPRAEKGYIYPHITKSHPLPNFLDGSLVYGYL